MDIPFTYFPEFVLRTPYFPIDFLDHVIKKKVSLRKIEEICKLPEIREAIFLASPSLFNKMDQWLKGSLYEKKEIKRTINSLIRYIVRMASRTTPFGLFSGVSTGVVVSGKTDILISPEKDYKRHTRLEMNYLCSLSKDLIKDKWLRRQLKYFPNSSMYHIGDYLRYVEYRYKNARRTHHIVEIENTEYLNKILVNAENGESYSGLVKLITNKNISKINAENFIDELIFNQILVSELDPNVTGDEFMQRIIATLSRINECDIYRTKMIHVSKMLSNIDKNRIGSTLKKYDSIRDELNHFNTEYDVKYLFQSDMKKRLINGFLSDKTAEAILEGLTFLKRISKKYRNRDLEKFRENYFARYEQCEMPLVRVLDVEAGIGYGINDNNSGDVSPLIDDILLTNHPDSKEISWNNVDSVILKKYLECLKSSSYSVSLSDKDFINFEANWDDTPDTFSVMVDVFKDSKGNEKIYIKSAGGASAVNLFGRFCIIDENIRKIVDEIIKKEESLNPDKIFAEIVHLPQSRTGNILMRPSIRKYEIPYLANSSVPFENQININDLLISLRGNKIVLRSKRLKKEVFPRLGTAHNYSNNALPIYKFLCDLQTQDLTGGFGFSWGPLSNEFEFLPRVEYKNLILYPATWNVKIRDYIKFLNKKMGDELISRITEWRKNKNIPSLILLADGDNKLLFNLENGLNVEIFHNLIKNRSIIKLEEYFYENFAPVVKSAKGKFINEFIFSFFRIGSTNERI